MVTGSPRVHDIRIAGHLDPHWSRTLGDLAITHHDDGTTTLTGPVVDQARLHGLLTALQGIGATLLSLHTAPEAAETAVTGPVDVDVDV